MSRIAYVFSTRTAKTITTAIITIIALLGTFNPAGANTATDEAQFVTLINQLRAQQGVAPLTVHHEMVATARTWSNTMATNDNFNHAPDLSVGVTVNWTLLGENIGIHSGADVNRLFDAFVASPTHYANMVDARFTHVGVGVHIDPTGTLWVTQRFMTLPTTTPAPVVDTTPAVTDTTPTADTTPETTTTNSTVDSTTDLDVDTITGILAELAA